MDRLIAAFTSFIVLGMLVSSASADPRTSTATAAESSPFSTPAVTTPQREGPAPHGSYRNQLLIADLAAYGVIAGAIAVGSFSDSDTAEFLVVPGLVAVPIGAPIVHLTHGESRRAMASFALRSVVPIAGGFGALHLTKRVCVFSDSASSTYGCGLTNAFLTGIALMIGGQVVDYMVLGDARETPAESQAPGWSWQPTVGVSPQGDASVGVMGSW